jgi:hypothetical protein
MQIGSTIRTVRYDLGSSAPLCRCTMKVTTADVRANTHPPGFRDKCAHQSESGALPLYAGMQNTLRRIQDKGNALAATPWPDAQKLFTVIVKIKQFSPYSRFIELYGLPWRSYRLPRRTDVHLPGAGAVFLFRQ